MTFTLDCPYYHRSFGTIEELIRDVVDTGMDPNHEVLCNGRRTGEVLADLIIF
jgi:hypothetical protein